VANAAEKREAIMSVQQRLGFSFSVALLAAMAIPAFAQTVSPLADSQEATASTPVFSGMWVHPYFPGVEPPASGPGPIFNRLHRPNGGGAAKFVGDYANPILKPAAAAIVKKHGEASLANITFPTPSNRCWPSGVPYIFFQPGVQVLQQPQQVVFVYLRGPEFRHVRLNDAHPAGVTPSWYGDSVGHYEGDTLVVDTVAIKADRPFAMVDMYGTPFSPALHVVERYRMIDYEEAQAAVARNLKENIRVPDTASDLSYRGKRLQVVFTVEDEGVFTVPWSGVITYERPAMEWPEIVCSENPFEFFAAKSQAYVPTASKPDF
jgi:hypothetical protein